MHTSTLMIMLAMCVAVAAPATKVVVNGGVKECDQSDQVRMQRRAADYTVHGGSHADICVSAL